MDITQINHSSTRKKRLLNAEKSRIVASHAFVRFPRADGRENERKRQHILRLLLEINSTYIHRILRTLENPKKEHNFHMYWRVCYSSLDSHSRPCLACTSICVGITIIICVNTSQVNKRIRLRILLYQIASTECTAAIIAALAQLHLHRTEKHEERGTRRKKVLKTNYMNAKCDRSKQKKSHIHIYTQIVHRMQWPVFSYSRRRVRVFFVVLCIAMCTSAVCIDVTMQHIHTVSLLLPLLHTLHTRSTVRALFFI